MNIFLKDKQTLLPSTQTGRVLCPPVLLLLYSDVLLWSCLFQPCLTLFSLCLFCFFCFYYVFLLFFFWPAHWAPPLPSLTLYMHLPPFGQSCSTEGCFLWTLWFQPKCNVMVALQITCTWTLCCLNLITAFSVFSWNCVFEIWTKIYEPNWFDTLPNSACFFFL